MKRGIAMARKKRGLLHDAAYYAASINSEWRKSVQGVLEVGRLLIKANEKCDHGEFLRMFKGSKNAVIDPLPFGEKTAQRLMKVASNEVIANGAHAHHLPCEWTTLYELTKLGKDTLLAGIKAGEITADTTRAQAAAMHSDPVAKPEKPPHEEMADAVKNAVTRLVSHLTTREQFDYVRRRLQSLLAFLSAQEAEHGSRRPGKKAAAERAG